MEIQLTEKEKSSIRAFLKQNNNSVVECQKDLDRCKNDTESLQVINRLKGEHQGRIDGAIQILQFLGINTFTDL